MCKFLQKIEAFMRRIEPSRECPVCGYLVHGDVCDVCGENPDNVIIRGDKMTTTCHKCGQLVDGLDGPFSCKCR
jgi:hypothetical protein